MQYTKAILITADGEAIVCKNFAGVFHTSYNNALFANTMPSDNMTLYIQDGLKRKDESEDF